MNGCDFLTTLCCSYKSTHKGHDVLSVTFRVASCYSRGFLLLVLKMAHGIVSRRLEMRLTAKCDGSLFLRRTLIGCFLRLRAERTLLDIYLGLNYTAPGCVLRKTLDKVRKILITASRTMKQR